MEVTSADLKIKPDVPRFRPKHRKAPAQSAEAELLAGDATILSSLQRGEGAPLVGDTRSIKPALPHTARPPSSKPPAVRRPRTAEPPAIVSARRAMGARAAAVVRERVVREHQRQVEALGPELPGTLALYTIVKDEKTNGFGPGIATLA